MAQSSKNPRPKGKQAKRQDARGKHRNDATASVHTNSKALSDRICAEVKPIVESHGLYLEQVKVGRQSHGALVRVTVDLPAGPGGVDSETLTDVSRALSVRLDDVDLVQGAYNLEVSTPGAERLLTEPRHYSRSIGRLVAFRLTDGSTLDARVVSLDGDKVTVEGGAVTSIAMSDIASARVQVELGRVQDADLPEDED